MFNVNPPQRSDHDFRVMEAMQRYGGGFVAALAEAAFRADDGNLARIRAAFPELWAQYGNMQVDPEESRPCGDPIHSDSEMFDVL